MSDYHVIAHAHGIYQLDADYIAEGLASVYLLEQQGRLAIIETGTASSAAHLLALMADLGYQPEQVDWIILTHIHLDHAAGAGTLMQHCPQATLVVHPRGARHMIDPQKLEAGTRAVYGDEQYQALYGALVPVAAQRVMSVEDQQTLDFNGRTLTFFDTPGHALHHICIHDSASNAVFTGDTCGLSYRQFDDADGRPLLFVTTTPVHFDPQAMRASINRIWALLPEALYLTHFGPVAASDDNRQQLFASLEVFVALAQQQDDEASLTEAILNWLTSQLRQRGLDDDQARRWLQTDARLNAQGLLVWRQRQAG